MGANLWSDGVLNAHDANTGEVSHHCFLIIPVSEGRYLPLTTTQRRKVPKITNHSNLSSFPPPSLSPPSLPPTTSPPLSQTYTLAQCAHRYARQMVLRDAAAMGWTTFTIISLIPSVDSGTTCPFSPRMNEHLFSTISEAPLVNMRYPPPGKGMTVVILLRAELKVKTFVKISVGWASLIGS